MKHLILPLLAAIALHTNLNTNNSQEFSLNFSIAAMIYLFFNLIWNQKLILEF